jgi:hypothetical protein
MDLLVGRQQLLFLHLNFHTWFVFKGEGTDGFPGILKEAISLSWKEFYIWTILVPSRIFEIKRIKVKAKMEGTCILSRCL